jgi:hypothetical protein
MEYCISLSHFGNYYCIAAFFCITFLDPIALIPGASKLCAPEGHSAIRRSAAVSNLKLTKRHLVPLWLNPKKYLKRPEMLAARYFCEVTFGIVAFKQRNCHD